jgi:carbamoylphosphate synthase large subunit
LNYDDDAVFKSSRGSRENAVRILLLFVNEDYVLGSRLLQFLTRDMDDVEVFVVAVGSRVDNNSALRKLASKPYDIHFLTANNYDKLKRIFTGIKYKGIIKHTFNNITDILRAI